MITFLLLNGEASAETCSDLLGPTGDEQPKCSEKLEVPVPLHCALPWSANGTSRW